MMVTKSASLKFLNWGGRYLCLETEPITNCSPDEREMAIRILILMQSVSFLLVHVVRFRSSFTLAHES